MFPFSLKGISVVFLILPQYKLGRGGSVEANPTTAVYCSLSKHLSSPKVLVNIQEAVAPSQHDWKIVDRDVEQKNNKKTAIDNLGKIYCLQHVSFCRPQQSSLVSIKEY